MLTPTVCQHLSFCSTGQENAGVGLFIQSLLEKIQTLIDLLTPHSVPEGKAGCTGPQGVPGAWQWGWQAPAESLVGTALQGSIPRLWHIDPALGWNDL